LGTGKKNSPPQIRVEIDERFHAMMNAPNKTTFLWVHAPHVAQNQFKIFLTAMQTTWVCYTWVRQKAFARTQIMYISQQ
jgi:hypothetical protein